MRKAQTIYFDESGFTGNNLLSPDQPAFVYASVAIDPPDAVSLHAKLISRFKIEGKELKGKNLVKYRRGQEAVSYLLAECQGIACLAVSDKNFALAGKFYEYIFEPVLMAQNSLFYAIEFHRFIANLLYVLFKSKDEDARYILDHFESLMKTQDLNRLEHLLTPVGLDIKVSDPLGQILTFTMCHRKKIEDAIKDLADVDGISRWALELTATSLFWLLSFWSESFDLMEVYCDKSEPLGNNRSIFDVMVNRKERIYVKFGNQPERPLTFNLTAPIELLDSRQSPGIQIADVLSSSIAFALKNPGDELAKKWMQLARDMFGAPCIVPDTKAIDLRERDPYINALVLHELVDRTVKGESLFTGMPEYIEAARQLHRLSPPPYLGE